MKRVLQCLVLVAMPLLAFGVDYFVITPEMEVAAVEDMRSMENSLPLMAGVCEIIGVGRVTNAWEGGVTVVVDSYWVGSPGSNTLSMAAYGGTPSATDSPSLFFASRYPSFRSVEPSMCWYSRIFDMAGFRSEHEPESLGLFGHSSYSWIPATSNNADVVIYASNLVYAAQISVSTNTFYETLRDGLRSHPPSSCIYKDSMIAFSHFKYFMGTNFMNHVRSDPLLDGEARDWMDFQLQ